MTASCGSATTLLLRGTTAIHGGRRTAGIKSSARISDTYLNSISADKRKEMSEALHKSIDALESLTDKRWAYDAKDEGWSDVIDFIEERI